MTSLDPARWKQLSSVLDEVLDLPAPARAQRLEALRAQDPDLADEVAAFERDAADADAARFLDGSLAHTTGVAGSAGSMGTAAPDATAATAGAGRRAAEAAANVLEGQQIGAYELEALLGQGGTGTVWRARRADGRFEGKVAIKLLHLSLLGREGAQRFEREGAILARLDHPNIARLMDAGVTGAGQPYLVLELVEGLRIDRYCDASKLNVAQRLTIFAAVLGAVAHAHTQLVIHRDIKPSNILVSTEGVVKLLDFGIAKLVLDEAELAGLAPITREGCFAMTPEYAAPEQVRGQAVSTATDVYALGVLLYQLLVGSHPTAPPGGSPNEVMRATLETDAGRLTNAVAAIARTAADRDTSPQRLRRQLQGDLENIVARALRKNPAQRYPTVDALGEDLRRHLAHEPVSARPDSFGYRAGRFVTRHRGAVAAGVLTFVAVIGGLIGTLSQAHRAELQSQRANREAEVARQERDGALEQQRLQRGTNEFLQLLMRDAAGADPGAIRRQLDRAGVLITKTRFEAPIIKVALLRQTASRYAELGDMGRAGALLRQAIAATDGTDLTRPTSAVPVNLACTLGRYLVEMDEPGRALAELDRADRLMAAGADLTLPSRVECRMARGFTALALGHVEDGIVMTREALQALEAAGVRDGEQHRVLRSALSRALLQGGLNAQALAIAAPLLADSVAGQGRESMVVVRRSSVVTSLMRAGGQPLAALPMSEADQASAAHLLGPAHPDPATDLEHGRVLMALARDAEAASVLQRAAAVAREQGHLRLVLPAELAAAQALLRSGRTAAAVEVFAKTEPDRVAALREGRPAQFDGLQVEAALAAARGDLASATRALDTARSQVDAAGGDTHSAAQGVAMARAEAALAGGRIEPARAECQRALAAAQRSALDVEKSSDIGRALALRARIERAAGRREPALGDAGAALRHLAATLGASHPETRAAVELRASLTGS